MQTKARISKRGTITIPAPILAAFGLKASDEVVIDRTPEGILLRPVICVPLEIYTEKRTAEFASDEKAIARHLPKRR